MGFFSKLGNMATGGFGFTNPASMGGLLNDITGATSSAALQQKYALQNAAINHAYQKEFAQNAHQWEAQDLQKAGYNPALTATGGSGASASGGGSFGGGGGQSAMNPFDILNSIVGMANQTSATKSQNKLAEANAIKAITESKNLPEQVQAQLIAAYASQSQAETAKTNANTNKKAQKTNEKRLEIEKQKAFTDRYKAMVEGGRAPYQNALDQANADKIRGGEMARYLGTWYNFR